MRARRLRSAPRLPISDTIAELPAGRWAVLALFYRDGLSVVEVATALTLPPGTVKTRLMHARNRLRALMTVAALPNALREDDLGLPAEGSEPGFYALAFSLFSGRQGWVTWVLAIVQTLIFIAAFWAGWQFYAASEVLGALKWGLSAATLAILATQLKLSLMPQMQANRVILALRRLELRLAARHD